ncbi:flagellar basal body-associated FliL family protein [Guptibacillus algicola]|uniref:flagellar basal body-associated FliL family protein n=1 Tax=Guptibacillus algicola TaxID=225844 RepID=UPI001CD41ADF|nr:flagellar basal body-associated FliL family protein [Alkalihalobacillus algicola]MCA0988896.1 flagellar basal body-associated FliL family protein [Alkalihalobacillus algicola]
MKRILLIILATLGVVGGGAFAAVFFLDIDLGKVLAQEEKEPTAEELAARSYSMEPITTNLLSDHYAVVQLNLLADGEKSYHELEVRNPELKSIVISTLANLSRSDLKGAEGLKTFEESIRKQINDVLQDGDIERVLVIDFKIQ